MVIVGAGPVVGAAMVVGVAIALLQALTQVQEMTLDVRAETARRLRRVQPHGLLHRRAIHVFTANRLCAYRARLRRIGARPACARGVVAALRRRGLAQRWRDPRKFDAASSSRNPEEIDCVIDLNDAAPGPARIARGRGHRVRGRHHPRPLPVLPARSGADDRLRPGVFDRAVGADPDGRRSGSRSRWNFRRSRPCCWWRRCCGWRSTFRRPG